MVGVQVFSVKQVLCADGARPVLADRDAKEFRAPHPVGFPIPSAPVPPVVTQGWVIGGGGAFDLHVPLNRHAPQLVERDALGRSVRPRTAALKVHPVLSRRKYFWATHRLPLFGCRRKAHAQRAFQTWSST